MFRSARVLTLACCAMALAAAHLSAAEMGVRIRFGLEDKSNTKWDGTVEVSEGRVSYISGWRFTAGDEVQGRKGWKASTRPVAQTGRGNNQKKAAARNNQRAGQQNTGPMADNGVVVSFTGVDDKSKVSIKTAQGDFDFTLGELPYGTVLERLKGGVEIERTATAHQLTTGRTDDDYPAAAVTRDGTLYVAYVSFTPGLDRDKYNELEAKQDGAKFVAGRGWAKAPDDFGFLAKQAGGDQVWLRVRRKNEWSEPIAVTPPGNDVYKCSMAVDGAGRATVCWSQNVNWPAKPLPNFEIMARTFDGTAMSDVVNLSQNEANDVNPALATDAQGKVWLAWQGVRDGVFQIVERHQQNKSAWSAERRVSTQTRSCWSPAVAAAADGRIGIAWDTYEKGDYDIWLREFTSSDGAAGEARPVANTIDYEARPSLSYSTDGALWIGYELGTPTWGKNFGPMIEGEQGNPLYRGRQIGLIVWKDGQWHDPTANYIAALPGAKARKRVNNQRVPAIEPQGESPRQALQAEALRDLAYNNVARVVADRSGHVWLFCRSRQNDFRFPVLGSLWLSWAAYYDGQKWTGPILLPNSDNLMYNTPSVVAMPAGGLIVAHSTDHRQDRFPVRDPATKEGPGEAWTVPGDPFDNDIYISNLRAPKSEGTLALKPAAYPPKPSNEAVAATVAERAAIARCRAQQIQIGGRKLQLIRGEFHRHTEISGDGGNDGPLEDMWRYAMDVAAMDWLGCGDHDNGAGREYTWWLTQKTTDAFRIAGSFEPPFSYERSVSYPEGHRNVVFVQRGVRTLPRLPITDRNNEVSAPDTQMLYRYLKHFGGVCASHTSATSMGTDWRNNDPEVEPMVEIYQGDRQNYERPGAPRCPKAEYSIGGWEPKGFVNLALLKGYRLAFECSSDHISTHISYANAYAENNSPAALVKAMKERHIYGATDNIVADYRCKADGKEYMLGDEFSSSKAPTFTIRLVGTAPFAKLTMVKDDVEIPLTISQQAEIETSWTDPQPVPGKTSYYYVRGEQTDGELVWVSAMWVKFAPTSTAAGQ